MASQPRLNAYLTEWSSEALNPATPTSHTSPPFSTEARPGIVWKLTVRNGIAGPCPGHAAPQPDQHCRTCEETLEFSLELEGGGEPKELEPELFLTITAETRTVGDPGRLFHSSVIREFPSKLRYDIKDRDSMWKAVVSACVSFGPPADELPHLVNGGLSRLLDEPMFADFEVRVGEERIPIHRNIFASFSPVFTQMFQRDMEEKAQGFVVIEDVSAETMRGLRAFLYSGRVAEVRAGVPIFLHLAEKYQIAELKRYCHAQLRKTLSPSNLCSVAVLAKRYGLAGLFEDCRAAVKKTDGTPAVGKEDWDRLVRDHQDVALALLQLRF